MTHSNPSISPLRQRMIDDMTLRRLAPKTQTAYPSPPSWLHPKICAASNCTWSRPGYPPPRLMPPSPAWGSCSA
jgi:hypothetical protein